MSESKLVNNPGDGKRKSSLPGSLKSRALGTRPRLAAIVVGVLFATAPWGPAAHGSLGESGGDTRSPSAKAGAASKKTVRSKVQSGAGGGDKRVGKGLDFGRTQMALPSSTALKTPVAKARDIRSVKPPSSSDFYEGTAKEIEYEKLLDEEIRKYYELTQKYKSSRSRGEFWLRLAERYVEKSELIEFREQAEFDKKLRDYLDKKTRRKPKVDLRLARNYNKKAIQLYEWFLRDFPKDKKIDQALFFLGYNHFESGATEKGEEYYKRLVTSYPKSAFVIESYFALGEYYFENDRWQEAYSSYRKVIDKKKARLNVFAMFKGAWCLYRLNKVEPALKMLERVVRMSRGSDSDGKGGRSRAVNKVRLAAEALKDYVPFYAEAGDYKEASREFARVAQDESLATKMLDRLAFIYADAGNRTAANAIFKELIALNPRGERAAEYQYQIILTYATADQRQFRQELVTWLENFGPKSDWETANAKNKKLIEDTARLQETTLRNHVLQMHQTAQNSRAQFSQQQANSGYALYLRYFHDGPQAAEMRFFHGELLFDMRAYQDSAKAYTWSAAKDPKGKYRDKAITNAVLALERDLPTTQEIDRERGESIEKMPLPPTVIRFKEAATQYFAAFPKGEKTSDIKRRLGVLYYSYNYFEPAMDLFEQILKEDPKSQNAEIAGNLLLDIYKLRGDMAGLADRGRQLLQNPSVARSQFGSEVRDILQRTNFLRAQKLAESKNYAASAKEFEAFANSYKGKELGTAALYSAGVNYEKAGDVVSAVRMHGLVLSAPATDAKAKQMQKDSRNSLARLYAQTGNLAQAARSYESYASQNPGDQTAVNAYFNAAVIWDALGEYPAAIRNYDAYMAKSKKSDRMESLFFRAEIAYKQNALTKAGGLYEQYLSSGARDAGNAIKARFQLAEIARRLQRESQARERYQKTIATYMSLKRSGQDVGVRYAAEARFFLARATLNEIRAVRFTSSDKQQAQAAAQLKSLRERYISEMKEVIRFDYAPMIVAALTSSGQMFDYIAVTLSKIPVPAGFSAEDGKKYKELVQQEINAVREEAKGSYTAARTKAIELESFGEWAEVAARGLAQHDSEAAGAGELSSAADAADWMGL